LSIGEEEYMKRRKWRAQDKAKVVLEYLQTQKTAEICTKYEIHQNQLYTWRDEFLKNAHRAFEVNGDTRREQSLAKEIKELKTIIGDLTVELKKNDGEGY
jgi:transposase-like protein